MNRLTSAKLKEFLHYNPDNGDFTWIKPRSNVKAGRIAGCVWERSDGLSYRLIRLDGLHLAHRLAVFYMTGDWPVDLVDHRDGNGLNNAWNNLRAADSCQNQANRKASKNNSIGVKGVRRAKQRSGFTARIMHKGKEMHLGTFPSIEGASQAYANATNEFNGSFARS